MYSEDLYASHMSDHSVLFIYCAVFSVMILGVILRMTFHSDNKEYKYTDN
jgi:hypothetical protein